MTSGLYSKLWQDRFLRLPCLCISEMISFQHIAKHTTPHQNNSQHHISNFLFPINSFFPITIHPILVITESRAIYLVMLVNGKISQTSFFTDAGDRKSTRLNSSHSQ